MFIGFPGASIFLGGGWPFIVFWHFPPFEGSAVLLHFRSRPFLALVGMRSMGIPWGLLFLMGMLFAALLEWLLSLAYEGAARWGGDALFVVIEGGGVLRHCWSDPSLFACGSRAYRLELALVLKGLGVFRHLWIYPFCCLCGRKACV
ncbi:hypothetical protein [Bartonella sp. OT172YNZD]|uniref:hypothetical protein n=1 Tax=Bartonella sp. OT172YNZD TaxID=3243572 RepID=UPI0035CE8715